MAVAPRSPGLLGSLRHLLDSGLQLLQVRLALLGNELEEQKLRLAQALMLGALGALLLALAAVLACGLVLLLFWEQRLAVLVVLLLVFAATGACLLAAASRQVRTAGAMFEASVQELRRDRAALATALDPEQP